MWIMSFNYENNSCQGKLCFFFVFFSSFSRPHFCTDMSHGYHTNVKYDNIWVKMSVNMPFINENQIMSRNIVETTKIQDSRFKILSFLYVPFWGCIPLYPKRGNKGNKESWIFFLFFFFLQSHTSLTVSDYTPANMSHGYLSIFI